MYNYPCFRWLEQFGYLSESLNSGEVVPPSQDMKRALRKMQRYAQLPVTGKYGKITSPATCNSCILNISSLVKGNSNVVASTI